MSISSPWSQLTPMLQRFWGFDSLRPLQEKAIRCGVEGRDSLVVMPTGGGKSLCFQVPPLLTDSLTIVLSPLIALMKDQVDALRLAGYPAAALNSHTTPEDARAAWRLIDSSELRLLYLAPERLFAESFIDRIAHLGITSFAIDEAHCISQWGHDFRPEYRRLASLRDRFPRACINAFTATATPLVRDDIVQQLQLRDPEVMVGCFDRPNLTYRVVPRTNAEDQIEEAVRRHNSQAAIVYCISRKQTEAIADELCRRKINAKAYHAGLTHERRRAVQDAFAQERLNVVVATVAFGMGIDRSDVRCVIHAAHPKSIEAYQQETGRAGRDGLPSECVLLYSGADAQKWEMLIEKSASESEVEVAPEFLAQQRDHVRAMQRFCTAGRCRHAMLSEYFGQQYEPPAAPADSEAAPTGCGGCDVCLGELEPIPDATVVAQKIVSCVARLAMQTTAAGIPMEYGVRYIAEVLRGRSTKNVLARNHDKLPTFGLLQTMSADVIISCINQLIDQQVLRRSSGEFPTVGLAQRARDLLKGVITASLVQAKAPLDAEDDAPPVEKELFEELRGVRRALAQERGVPAYMIFGDRTLEEMARIRPTTTAAMRRVGGVGEQKARDFAARFTGVILDFCTARSLPTDIPSASAPVRRAEPKPKGAAKGSRPLTENRRRAFEQFQHGASVDDIAALVKVATATASQYLVEYIERERPADIGAWVDARTYASIVDAAAKTGADRMKPIFEFLGGAVSYDHIKWTLAHQKSLLESTS